MIFGFSNQVTRKYIGGLSSALKTFTNSLEEFPCIKKVYRMVVGK